jgi:hypothetical protein
MSNVTIVTAYMNIYETPVENKDNSWRYQQFEKIAKSGVPICLFTDSFSYQDLTVLIEKYPNVKLMQLFNLEDTFCYKSVFSIEYSLPSVRNFNKDTLKYMFVQHSKIEFVHQAIEENPWNTDYFAWLDFSAAYNFSKLDSTLEYLSILTKRKFIPKLFAIPGCWGKLSKDNVPSILNEIHWRFCGTFFLGDTISLNEFFELYKLHFEPFIRENKKLIWEVNFWAWLERNTDWNPNWYNGDHNDSIFDIPIKYYAIYLNDNLEKTYYNYPYIENYYPSSPAYLYNENNGDHILNTRYVNYSYSPSGYYSINDPKNTLITKNIVSVLDNDLIPFEFHEMDESEIELPVHDTYSIGLEDIRLYNYKDNVKFIATNVHFVGNRKNRIIIGDYNYMNNSYSNCKIIQPPTDTGCEKNWIPLVSNDEEYFIYKWCPFQLGKINNETKKLEIIQSYEIKSPEFHRIRGSTTFIDKGDHLLGVVHFCEEMIPRQYYHVLVTLDKHTFKPISYSDPFCFQHYGVEFCIGFTIQYEKYVFWISMKDNNAIMVSVDMDKIPICHSIFPCL